jgi:hypothetical protein
MHGIDENLKSNDITIGLKNKKIHVAIKYDAIQQF